MLFLLPKSFDFIKTWKKSAPQMKIECFRTWNAKTSTEISARELPIYMLPICNITQFMFMATYMKLRSHFQKRSKYCSFWDCSWFSENLRFSFFEHLRHNEGPLSSINQHSNILGAFLFNNNGCSFCSRKMWILSILNIQWNQKISERPLKCSCVN